MIHRIYSDLSSFKELEFHPGLNILIAQKSQGATDLQTRNGAGKTSLIELIHFLLGANAPVESIFKKALSRFNFGMELEVNGIPTTVERSGSSSNKVKIPSSSFEGWPIQHPQSNLFEGQVISLGEWKSVLGNFFFNLPVSNDDEEKDLEKFKPTFRSLFSYFVRRQSEGSFDAPEKFMGKQPLWSQQVNLSYLIGLDWTLPQQWQKTREREKTLVVLRKAVKEGAFGDFIGSSSELRTKLAIAEQRASLLHGQLNQFQVLPEYHELEQEASEIATQLGTFADDNTIDIQLIEELQVSVNAETPPSFDALEQLYREVGIIFSDNVVRRFDDVRNFHSSVIENRKIYLSVEVTHARQRIINRNNEMEKLEVRLKQIMGILKAYGALDQFVNLQSELSRLQSDVEGLRQKFESAEQLEGLKAQSDIERAQLLLRLQQDFRERFPALQTAILTFEDLSNSMYEKAGSLNINDSQNGPTFDVKIQGEKSTGIKKMQIFCFDMMSMRICSEKGLGPGFIVHDSHLFDGVDSRQIAKALLVGADMANKYGFQYIVTMNDDVLPREYLSEIDLDSYILPVRLTDATDNGGLFGFRFD